MKETILYAVVYFAIAYATGLFYPVFYAIIGAPKYFPVPGIGQVFADVEELQLSKPGMVFRWYGRWLCRKQNEFEREHDKSLLHRAEVVVQNGIEGFKFEIETSYGRNNLEELGVQATVQGGKTATFNMRLFRNESAMVKYMDGEVEGTVVCSPVYPKFERSRMPLSPYKALGLCSACTVFWFMLPTLISACALGLFPCSFITSFIILPAYGLAIWGSQTFEI